ncbi:Snf7-domain-containing protein [Phlyctochytrium arcticum]|nr:Snf7-domain-containing protein [Phlyctochytrium arcticum]
MGQLISKDKAKGHRTISRDKASPKDKAILDLKIQRDKLKQYQKKIQAVLDQEVAVAKHHLKAGDQGRALLALKKKKYQEQLLIQTDQQLFTLEQLTGQIEYALVEQDVIKGLEQGNEILKQIHQETSLDAVQKLMDDTADAIAYQAEIDELISGQITAEDEEDIMAQLDALEDEALAEKLPPVPGTPLDVADPTKTKVSDEDRIIDLPSVPSKPLPQSEPNVPSKIKERARLEEPLPA